MLCTSEATTQDQLPRAVTQPGFFIATWQNGCRLADSLLAPAEEKQLPQKETLGRCSMSHYGTVDQVIKQHFTHNPASVRLCV